MTRIAVLYLAIAFFAGACAPQQQTIYLTSKFNPDEAEFILNEGDGTILGQAFLRQRGGGVVTCAGSNVLLIPRTKYAEERMRALYGTTDGGVNYGANPKFIPDSFDYSELTRTAQCDAQGNFEFSNVPSGRFFVATYVVWEVANVPQGGAVMKPVELQPGQRMSVLLTG